VNSLEGVFIANKLSSHLKGKINLSKKTEVTEDTEAMIQNRLDKMRRSQNTNINRKQQRTKDSINKEGEDLASESNGIRTYITHNKGGRWELIKAPTTDLNGEKIDCYLEEGCSLNLEIYSSNGRYAPPYS